MGLMSIVLAGFALGLSLIVAIGPQNALLIKQGIKRESVGVVIAICLISDVVLIFGGTAGVGVLVENFPIALTVLKYGGAAYLIWFAFTCFRDAVRPNATGLDTGANKVEEVASFDGTAPAGGSTVATKTKVKRAPERTWVKPALAALAFTWINPVTYIDVLVMLGGIANQYGTDDRWLFALGAIFASTIWFPTIGFMAGRFSSTLAQPRVWRIINFAIGTIMSFLVFKLLFLV